MIGSSDAREREFTKPEERVPPTGRRSLCPDCKHIKLVCSDHGSTFYLCRLAATDARFAKYPPQPVLACSGFER